MPHLTVIMLIRLPPWQKFSRLYFEKFITNNCHSNFEICRLNFLRLTVTIVSVNRKIPSLWLVAGLLCFLVVSSSFAQGTAFQYQGQLSNGSSPANGNYDFQFTLYNAVTNGSPLSGTETNFDVGVTNGLFTTTLDFGQSVFNGQSVWLNIGVRTNGSTPFTLLSPLQPVLPVPYAIFANSASNLVGTLSGSAFTGFTNAVSLTNGANLFSGSFSGNGGSVTNVNVTNLTGVLADSQLPNNTAYLNSNQLFTANNTFNGTNTFNGVNTFTNLYGNSFSGSFFGNGLVGWVVVAGTNQQASIDTGYLLTNSQLDTVSLPTTAHVGDVVRISSAGISGWELAQFTGQSVIGTFLGYGQTWYLSGSGAQAWTDLASSSEGTKLVASSSGSSGNVWISGNSGQTWSGTTANGFATAWQSVASSSDGTRLYAAVSGGSLYFSTNTGSAWSPLASSSGAWTSIACSADGTRMVAGLSTSAIWTTLNNTFITSKTTAAAVTSVASSASGNYLVAGTYSGNLYVSSNYGTNWNPEGSSLKWSAVACSDDGSKMAAAVSNGTIYVSSNFGLNWTATTAPTKNWTSIASSSDGSKLVAVAAQGGIYTSPNFGVNWMLQTNYNAVTNANWTCATSSSSGNVLAAGISGTLTTSPYGIFTSQASTLTQTTTGTNGFISGSQGSAVELQCVGNNQWMPVSSAGTLWGQ